MIAEAFAPSLRSKDETPHGWERARPILIRKVAVLGAGAMGSRIAAHFANAGVPAVLLDIVPANAAPDKAARNAIAVRALERLKKSKPAAFFDPDAARLITIGNFEDDLELVADCDWIVEAVTERSRDQALLLTRVDGFRRSDAIVTTNTSGLPVSQIAEGMPEDFRRNWFGTHFFNPPRYMRLFEIIPAPEPDPAAIDRHRTLCRPPARQVSGRAQRHTQFHRQSHWHVRADERHPGDAGDGPDHRAGGCSDGLRAGLA